MLPAVPHSSTQRVCSKDLFAYCVSLLGRQKQRVSILNVYMVRHHIKRKTIQYSALEESYIDQGCVTLHYVYALESYL